MDIITNSVLQLFGFVWKCTLNVESLCSQTEEAVTELHNSLKAKWSIKLAKIKPQVKKGQ